MEVLGKKVMDMKLTNGVGLAFVLASEYRPKVSGKMSEEKEIVDGPLLAVVAACQLGGRDLQGELSIST